MNQYKHAANLCLSDLQVLFNRSRRPQHTATHCNTPQHTAAQHVLTDEPGPRQTQCVTTYCSALQSSVLQKTQCVAFVFKKDPRTRSRTSSSTDCVNVNHFLNFIPPIREVYWARTLRMILFSFRSWFFLKREILWMSRYFLLILGQTLAPPSTLQHTATHCKTLQLQSNETCPSSLACKSSFVWKGVMSTLPAVCCSVL